MTRKKVKLAFIANDSARKATFKKRKKGMMKKVSELSTLCGIDACAIVYSPYDSQQPDVWPDMRGAHQVVTQFKRMPEMEQSKKMVNQESFLRARIAKATEQLKKLHKDNREKEITHLTYTCLAGKGLAGMAVAEITDVGWLIDRDLKEIYKRIDVLKKGGVFHAPPPKMEEKAMVELGGAAVERQWFADWSGSVSMEQGQMGGGAFGGHGGGTVGEEMIMQFNDGVNNNNNNNNCNNSFVNSHGGAAIWSSAFFP